MTRVLIGISALMLAGCSMTPAYERPAAPVPATLPQGEAYAPRPAGAQAGLAWTQLVQDARLRTIIDRALANNRDLRAAIANVQSARAQYR
ncbi:MAG: transporter, partial [Pseudomonadota bacterium]|nr:transporter [Pseudomonadota bacterium]